MDQKEKALKGMVDALESEDFEGIGKDFNQTLKDAFPLETSVAFFKKFYEDAGKMISRGPYKDFRKMGLLPVQFDKGTWDFRVLLDDKGLIAGFWILPHHEDPKVVDKHETELSLPFKGRWYVCQGGDTIDVNHHVVDRAQRHAFDIVVAQDNMMTWKEDPRFNENYFAFGQEILSPADGTVIEVVNGIRDGEPMFMNPFMAFGNYISIQHKELEVSLVAHVKLDSFKVKVGDKVKKGQVVGLCGNSGHSWEAHIHYQLMNVPSAIEGTGIKTYFKDVKVTRGGKSEVVERYTPLKGDFIEPAGD
jgi:hypothetical protein